MTQPTTTEPGDQTGAKAAPRQRIWPLFVLALGLAVFGFYLAFKEPVESGAAVRPMPDNYLRMPEPPAVEGGEGGPVELGYVVDERSYRVEVEQELRRGDATARSRLAALVTEAPDEDGSLKMTYSDVAVQLDDGDEPVGSEVAREVERLLEVTAHRIEREPTGEVTQFELTSSESAQLRQTVALLRDGIDVAHPRLPREPVLAGESWSWTMLATGTVPEGAAGEISSEAVFEATLMGRTADGHLVLATTVRVSGKGTFVEEEQGEHELLVAGKGEGWALIAGDTGRLVTSHVSHTLDYSYDGRTISSTIAVHLSNE